MHTFTVLTCFAACLSAASASIHPVPRKSEPGGGVVMLSGKAEIGGAESADPAAAGLLESILAGLPGRAGVAKVVIGERGDPAVSPFLGDLPEVSGAYRLVVRDGGIAVAGHDGRGTYYGVRTLERLMAASGGDGRLPAVEMTDWPEVPFRGVVEGFYGTPWSHEKRLRLIRFMGGNKMNTYIYGPKDDPYHSSPHWRKPYPEAEAARIRELAETCRRHHVDFVWAVHPGKDIRWDDADFANVLSKFEAMYSLGVRSFSVFFDDISGEGTKADQQARLLNFLHEEFVAKKGDVTPLVMCPTQYNRSWSGGDYLDVLGERLHPSIHVMWTGDRVVADLDRPAMEWINGRLKRRAYVWWNFPVSDYVRNHLLMGPAYGNAPDIGEMYGGFVSNPMERSEASMVALFGVADYTWNPAAYDAEKSWKAGIRAVLPGAPEAFETFCSHNSDLGPNGHGYRREESVAFKPAADAFLAAFREGKTDGIGAVRDEMVRIAEAPGAIRKNAGNPLLLEEIGPWLDAFGELGKAGVSSLEAAAALGGGDTEDCWEALLSAQGALAAMAEIDRTNNRNPHQPGVKTGTLVIEPLVREVVSTTGARLVAKLSGRPVFRLSGITSSTERESLPRMLDGKDDTWFYCREIQKKDDWFGVDLGGVHEVRRVRILQGRNDGDHDLVHTGVIEGFDGRSWTRIADAGGARIDVELGKPAAFSRIRLRVVEPGKADGSKPDVWTAIRRFEVNPADRAVLRTDVPALAAQPVSVSGGVFSVSPSHEVHAMAAGKSLGLLFPGETVVSGVEVDLKVDGPARHFLLEGSADGNGWTRIPAVEEGTKLVAGASGSFRAVRIRNHGRSAREITLSAFKVTTEVRSDVSAALTDGDPATFVEIGRGDPVKIRPEAGATSVLLLLGENPGRGVEVFVRTPKGRRVTATSQGILVEAPIPPEAGELVLTAADTSAPVRVHEVIYRKSR